MKTYLVQIPLAGHVSFEIEAKDEDSAMKIARDKDPTGEDAELTWETMDSFGYGNVCCCPSPWEITAEEI